MYSLIIKKKFSVSLSVFFVIFRVIHFIMLYKRISRLWRVRNLKNKTAPFPEVVWEASNRIIFGQGGYSGFFNSALFFIFPGRGIVHSH